MCWLWVLASVSTFNKSEERTALSGYSSCPSSLNSCGRFQDGTLALWVMPPSKAFRGSTRLGGAGRNHIRVRVRLWLRFWSRCDRAGCTTCHKSSMSTCRNCSFNATWCPTKQPDSPLAEEVPHASSSTWRRLFRGMKSSKLPRQVDSTRVESSSNGSWRSHRALSESLRTQAHTRSTRQLHPRCEHFAFPCFFFFLFPPSYRHSGP